METFLFLYGFESNLFLKNSKINADKQQAIKKLSILAQKAEPDFTPQDNLEALLNKEREDAWEYGGRTIHGLAKPKD